jgi:hypothetical protein
VASFFSSSPNHKLKFILMENCKQFSTLKFVKFKGFFILDARNPYRISELSLNEALYLKMRYGKTLRFGTCQDGHAYVII